MAVLAGAIPKRFLSLQIQSTGPPLPFRAARFFLFRHFIIDKFPDCQLIWSNSFQTVNLGLANEEGSGPTRPAFDPPVER
jgi:hypothetical protein